VLFTFISNKLTYIYFFQNQITRHIYFKSDFRYIIIDKFNVIDKIWIENFEIFSIFLQVSKFQSFELEHMSNKSHINLLYL